MSFNSEYYVGDKDQLLVQTPYGTGLVTRIRPRIDPNVPPMQEIRLLEWEKAARASQIKSKRATVLYSTTEYQSIPPKKGDDVITPYGRGTITEFVTVRLLNKGKVHPITKQPIGEEVLTKFHVQINSWRLAGRSRVKCYLFSNQVKVVRKKTVMEMNAVERVEFAMKQKQGASRMFTDKKYQEALNVYAGCIDAVRYIQHDTNNDNECRADLIDVMVTCSNNAATCCIQLHLWEEAFKFAKNALILLNALFEKRGAKIHGILNKDNGHCDAKMFGEWRVKSHIILARSLFEKDEYDLALDELKMAREHISYYVAGKGTTDQGALDYKLAKESVSRMRNQEREIIKLKSNITEKKKEHLKLERARAQAMFQDTATKSTKVSKLKKAQDKEEPAHSSENRQSSKEDETQNGAVNAAPKQLKKKVSFATNLEERHDIAAEEEEVEEEEPWYEEHKEALILLGVAVLTFASFALARRSKRI